MSERILVLDDGETWEPISISSRALVVAVTPLELERLGAGETVSTVLAGQHGRRLWALLIAQAEPPDDEDTAGGAETPTR